MAHASTSITHRKATAEEWDQSHLEEIWWKKCGPDSGSSTTDSSTSVQA